jgi:hypothetical protein
MYRECKEDKIGNKSEYKGAVSSQAVIAKAARVRVHLMYRPAKNSEANFRVDAPEDLGHLRYEEKTASIRYIFPQKNDSHLDKE